MFLNKLEEIYKSSMCNQYYNADLFTSFYSYFQNSMEEKRKYLTPYEFAYINSLNTEDAIRLFLFFTNEEINKDSALIIKPFFECDNHDCDYKIFLDEDSVDEGIYHCILCSKEYLHDEIISSVKIYFEINYKFFEEVEQYDKNSTYEILKRLPGNLKDGSPLSTRDYYKEEFLPDKGATSIRDVLQANQLEDGKVVSKSFEEVALKFAEDYSMFLEG